MRIRTMSAAAVAAGLLAIPVSGASAASAPAVAGPPVPPRLTFVPPKVGPISVDIAPTIINGKVVNPGLHVLMKGVSLPPISWTLPAVSWARPPIK